MRNVVRLCLYRTINACSKSRSDVDPGAIDSLLEHILKSSDGFAHSQQGGAIDASLNVPGVRETEDGYAEVFALLFSDG